MIILVAAIIIIMMFIKMLIWRDVRNDGGVLGKALTDQDKSNVAHWTEAFLKTYACYNALDSEFNYKRLKLLLDRDEVPSNVVVDVGMAHGRESQAAVQSGLIVYRMHFFFF